MHAAFSSKSRVRFSVSTVPSWSVGLACLQGGQVGQLRAVDRLHLRPPPNGIPARVSSGRWAAQSDPDRNAADEPHVKATFFATGVGWVPVDLGSALILDKSSEGLEFFGTENADFLIMHFDTDLEFDTVFFGRKTVETVQGPVFWVTGTGSFDDFKLLVTSRIQTKPLDLSRPFPNRSPGGRSPSQPPRKHHGQ